jgi:hypothetical protein
MSDEMNEKVKLPTIKIKGKDYTLVKDRILYFNERYPNGCINTDLISSPGDQRVVVKAIVIPDTRFPGQVFSDYSQALWGDGYINETSALENASTSAIGRALALMGIGVIESVASADEMHKAGVVAEVERQKKNPSKTEPAAVTLNDRLVASNKLEAEKRAALDRNALAEKQGVFSLDGDRLSCIVKGIQKKLSRGKEFLSVTFNGRLANGANYASCFDTELWEPIQAALDKECTLQIVVKDQYVNIKDVLWIDGVGVGGKEPSIFPMDEPA